MYTLLQFNTVYDLSLRNKRVFLRADLNVPLNNQTIRDDFRLKALMPTLMYIINHGGKIILATHIGRPKNQEPQLSTQVLIPWFEKMGFSIIHEADLKKAAQLSHKNFNSILLLENLRFFPGEKNGDPHFAQQLTDCADVYINDGFAVLHRHDTSVIHVPQLFSKEKKAIGFLIEKELTHLNKLLLNPAQPYVAVLGGGKVHDKLPLIKSMLDHAQTILLCPAIVNTFLKALGKPVGLSLVDDTALSTALEIITVAKEKNVKLCFPVDFQIAMNTLEGPLCSVDAQDFPAHGLATALGPKTVALFSKELLSAKTIFYNAGMGFAFRPETLESSNGLLQAIAQSSAYSVVGGGESVETVRRFDLEDAVSFLSSGGGATLTYLAQETLPALEVLKRQ